MTDIEQHHTGIGEPNEYSRPVSLLPTIGMVIRDAERALAQGLAIVNRDIDPASLPPEGPAFHQLDLLRESAGFHVEAALRDLRDIAKLPLPAVGSAVKLPLVSGEEEPTPGSVAAHGGAGESAGGLLPLDAGASSDPAEGCAVCGVLLVREYAQVDVSMAWGPQQTVPGRYTLAHANGWLPPDGHEPRLETPDPSPGSGAPVSSPVRGVGPGMVWPGTAAIAASINEALTRRSD